MTERAILLGRWKPYLSDQDSLRSIWDIMQQLDPQGPFIYAAIPYPYLQVTDRSHFTDQVVLGVDNMLNTQPGTYAEHFGAKMIQDAQAAFVLLGDQEARQLLGEDNDMVAHKIASALAAGLKVFACLDETNKGSGNLEGQLEAILQIVPGEHLPLLSLVYQGPWPTFYKDAHIVDDLTKGLETFKRLIVRLGGDSAGQIPLLLALPSRLAACDQVVEATAAQCAGYYFPGAATNPLLIGNVGLAWQRWYSGTTHVAPPEEEATPNENDVQDQN